MSIDHLLFMEIAKFILLKSTIDPSIFDKLIQFHSFMIKMPIAYNNLRFVQFYRL